MEYEKLTIELTKDEAIALFEFLTTFFDNENLNIEHQSEERVSGDLQCLPEQELSKI